MEKELLTAGSLALEQKQRSVIVIDATEHPQEVKLRVAAYCRVSSDSDDQLNSFAAQNRYYTTLIASKENWALVDIYADEGITGTSAQKRADFQRLMADCRRGLIDRVLTKSVSRFARNTKECLEAIRELKALGIGVQFEKEHLDTASMSGEMTAAMFAAFAQAESESISKNMRWSYQKRMQEGTFNTCSAPYGFRLECGQLVINREEAEIVQFIFHAYLSGAQPLEIARELAEHNTTARQWSEQTVKYILRNERYAGNAMLQKKYTESTFPYRRRKNYGEVNMYFVSGSNDAIISEATFKQAQALLQDRAQKRVCKPNPQPLNKMIVCGCCGNSFRSKQNKGIQYMVCCTHDSNINACGVAQIENRVFYSGFLRLYYKLKHQGVSIVSQLQQNLLTIRSRRTLWSTDVIELNKQISNLTSQSHTLAQLKQQGIVDPDIFISRSNELAEQLRAAKQKKERLLDAGSDEIITQTQELLDILDAGPDFLECFDEELFCELVDKIIVESNERLWFRLKNGLELPEAIERTVR